MSDSRGRSVSYNGEIFNFVELRRELEAKGRRFSTATDTEVLLAAYDEWGDRCVEHFVGMFAFGLWDPQRRGLLLARDRLGKKPLYYFHEPRSFVAFASRLGALLEHPRCPREIDDRALGLYLEAGFVPAPLAIIAGVRKIRPGHTLWISESGERERCYWSIDSIHEEPALAACPEETVERLHDALRESVRARLISDVPLGAFLSGGTDSAAVVAAMTEVSDEPPLTFTIGFAESGYDESVAASHVAAALGTNHRERRMRSSDLLDLLDDHAVHYDEPFADWSSLPTMMVSRFAREHVTVCLSGDGGDELFAGYPYYHYLRRIEPLFRLPSIFRRAAGKALTRTRRHRSILLGHALMQPDLVASFAFMRSMRKDLGQSLLTRKPGAGMAELFRERAARMRNGDLVSMASRLDITYYLADDILQKVDVASMAYGLEARVPLLDHRVVELALAMPRTIKERNGIVKWPLKHFLEARIGAELTNRPKRGFGAPIREWFRGELRHEIADRLSPERLAALPQINATAVQQLADLHLSGERDAHALLWSVLSLVRWYDGVMNASPAVARSSAVPVGV